MRRADRQNHPEAGLQREARLVMKTTLTIDISTLPEEGKQLPHLSSYQVP